MDYVEGESLDSCWARLDEAARADVADHVAGMIKQMGNVVLSIPRPIGGSPRCEGVWFSDYGVSSFQTIEDMEDWFNHKLDICEKYKQALPDTPRFKF